MSGHSGSGAVLVLVLFILLVIILVAASGGSRYDSLNPLLSQREPILDELGPSRF
ncbi:hypothetical protein VQL36_04900 [Chengkuizengella sp. SCS-71B]|uniref:hypothetical protein n=1 Tax=Chengkuizengella sp. SCS-71B TaxID=3115290 RepID=UPI0032C22D6B